MRVPSANLSWIDAYTHVFQMHTCESMLMHFLDKNYQLEHWIGDDKQDGNF
jgi:hypothetical protein